jgi:hypothetical protein
VKTVIRVYRAGYRFEATGFRITRESRTDRRIDQREDVIVVVSDCIDGVDVMITGISM